MWQLGRLLANAELLAGIVAARPFVADVAVCVPFPYLSSTAVALAELGCDVPFAFNRKEAKRHGEGGLVVGAPLAGFAYDTLGNYELVLQCLIVTLLLAAGNWAYLPATDALALHMAINGCSDRHGRHDMLRLSDGHAPVLDDGLPQGLEGDPHHHADVPLIGMGLGCFSAVLFLVSLGVVDSIAEPECMHSVP